MIAATGVILAAAYLLWALQRMLFNPLDKPENAALRDLNWRELGAAGAAHRRHPLAGRLSEARAATHGSVGDEAGAGRRSQRRTSAGIHDARRR